MTFLNVPNGRIFFIGMKAKKMGKKDLVQTKTHPGLVRHRRRLEQAKD